MLNKICPAFGGDFHRPSRSVFLKATEQHQSLNKKFTPPLAGIFTDLAGRFLKAPERKNG